ncbi:MAG: redoxin domain-containing protein [Myxococcota bacterium]|nr:redoxin domain-containing protein [Myxococcota bacterium]
MLFFLMGALLYAKPYTAKMGPIRIGQKRKSLYKYRPTASFLKKYQIAPHPEAVPEANYISVPVLHRRVLVMSDKVDGRYIVSADLDGNGIIEADERSVLRKRNGRYAATLSKTLLYTTAQKQWEIPFSVKILSKDPASDLGYILDTVRRGTLPTGDAFAIHSYGGLFHVNSAFLAIDIDGNGSIDTQNKMAIRKVQDGWVTLEGLKWQFQIEPDGSMVRFSKTGIKGTSLINASAPSFQVLDMQGRKHTLRQYRTTGVILDFWATWCRKCISDRSKLKTVSQKYNVPILGLNIESKRTLKRYMKKNVLSWPNAAIGSKSLLLQSYQIESYPTYVYIDEKGILKFAGSLSGLEFALQHRD